MHWNIRVQGELGFCYMQYSDGIFYPHIQLMHLCYVYMCYAPSGQKGNHSYCKTLTCPSYICEAAGQIFTQNYSCKNLQYKVYYKWL